jgi:hypothetical protein
MYISSSNVTFIYDAIDLEKQMNTKTLWFGTLKSEGIYSVEGKNGTFNGTKVALTQRGRRVVEVLDN